MSLRTVTRREQLPRALGCCPDVVLHPLVQLRFLQVACNWGKDGSSVCRDTANWSEEVDEDGLVPVEVRGEQALGIPPTDRLKLKPVAAGKQ